MKFFWINLKMLLWLTLMTGLVYPLFVTAIAQLTMKKKADGSLIKVNGAVIGSSLIAQKFEQEKYFWPRPSFVDYNPLLSGGSNLGPTSKKLKLEVAERAAKIIKVQGGNLAGIPSELLYASGSGLDPHISPSAARFQVDRIMKARGWRLPTQRLQILRLIEKQTEKRPLGFIGNLKVNVLELNLALDAL